MATFACFIKYDYYLLPQIYFANAKYVFKKKEVCCVKTVKQVPICKELICLFMQALKKGEKKIEINETAKDFSTQ